MRKALVVCLGGVCQCLFMFPLLCHDNLNLGFGRNGSHSSFKVSILGGGGMIMIHCLMNEIVMNSFPFLLKNGLLPAEGCKWHPLSLLVSALRSPGKAFCGATLRPSGIIKGVSLRIMVSRASPPLPPCLHDLGQVTEPFWGPAVLLCKVETTL